MARSRLTLLQREIMRRRLTREEAIRVLDQRASRMNVHDFALSLRQLDRWLAGEVATLPRPSMCRVIEAEFGEPVERLLGFVDDVPALPSSTEPEEPDVRAMVSGSAHRSARFGQWADSLAIGELAFAALWLRLRQLAVDYGPRGVLVNALAPGKILTGSPEQQDPETLAYSYARTPFHRLGRPDDVAGAALFLASDDCGYVSGVNLLVDGGWMAY